MFLTGVIPFRESNIITAKADNGEIYVAVRPMAEELGLAWNSQFTKIKNDGGYDDIITPLKLSEGGLQEMLCIPHKKVLKWLYSINANKVKPEHKAKLIAFQEETEWAIYEYWTKGEAKRTDFIGSEAYKELQAYLSQLEMEKRELNAEINEHLNMIEQNKRDIGWSAFWLHQDKLKHLTKMKEHATEFYAMLKEIDTTPQSMGTHYMRKKLDAFARRMWTQYSQFRDELELLEMQGA